MKITMCSKIMSPSLFIFAMPLVIFSGFVTYVSRFFCHVVEIYIAPLHTLSKF